MGVLALETSALETSALETSALTTHALESSALTTHALQTSTTRLRCHDEDQSQVAVGSALGDGDERPERHSWASLVVVHLCWLLSSLVRCQWERWLRFAPRKVCTACGSQGGVNWCGSPAH